MNYPIRLLVCAVVALLGHLLLLRGVVHLPPQSEVMPSVVVQVVLKAPPPEPEKPAEPEATPEPQEQPTHQPPRRRAMTEAPRRENVSRNPPPTERPATGTDTTTTPVFGISMESTSSAGAGVAMPVGNTLQTKQTRAKVAAETGVKPLAAPAQAYEVTKMPLPVGQCTGKYTEEAKQAGLEGTVILDFVVGEDGWVRDIKIVQGLSQGLNEAAVRAAKACRFTPGEKDGKRVPVRVSRFKVHFALAEAE
jgi:TonB family protein